MKMANLDMLRAKKGFICDMDGVLYHGNRLLPGVQEFVEFLKRENKKYLFLTNSSERAPRELAQKLSRLGLTVSEEHFYTSALSTAAFLKAQCPGGSAYVIGEPGLVGALYDAGFTMNDVNPDYVVLGETRTYSFDKIEKAVSLVLKGAKLIGTNSDLTGPIENGIVPATRALMAPIAMSTGRTAYYLGKPNPLMMRHGLKILGVTPEESAIIGDRMDTDIISGIESGIDTVLVLSGVTDIEEMKSFPYQPTYVLSGVGDIVP
jgi:NagD protein